MEAIHSKIQAQGATDKSMRNLQPGRSLAPPRHNLKASSAFLKGSVGRGGENQPEDLRKLATFLYRNGAPRQLLRQIIDPAKSGDVIARYQREVLGFGKGDGRIDPGGKTIAAILAQKGKETVAGWYEKKKGKKNEKGDGMKASARQKAETEKLAEGESWIIAPLMGKSDYITQAPPKEAAGAQTLTKSQLFSFALMDYGPGQSRDIEKKANWTRHSRWNHRKYGHWTDYEGALRATHWIACHNTCIYMARNAGVAGVSQDKGYNQKMKASEAKGEAGQSLIDPQLQNGNVVVVRVDGHHSVLIIGKGRDAEGEFYAFFDPGRTGTKGHNLKANRLYISDESIKNAKYKSITSVRHSTPQ